MKKRLFAVIVPVCILLVILLALGIGRHPAGNNPPSADGPQETAPSNDAETVPPAPQKPTDNNIEILIDPSPYPGLWKQMNALIVKWGEQNEYSDTDSFMISFGEEARYTVEYVGVDVEVITLYAETTQTHPAWYVEELKEITFLMIPKYHLEEIKVGDTALVFVERLREFASQDQYGMTAITPSFGPWHGTYLAPDKYVPAPIFPIKENRILVDEACYEREPQSQDYYMPEMNYMQEANEYIREHNPENAVTFENGMRVEDLSYLLTYICQDQS